MELECYQGIRSLLSITQLILEKWEWLADIDLELSVSCYQACHGGAASVGRGLPPFCISKDQLLYLSSLSFSWSDLARMTIYRRRLEYNLVRDPNTFLDDSQLRIVLRELKQENPQLGEVTVMGRIQATGYNITQD